MSFLQKTIALIMSTAIVLGVAMPVLATDEADLDSVVNVIYHESLLNYVSIDTKEKDAKSEWFYLISNASAHIDTMKPATIHSVVKDDPATSVANTELQHTLSLASYEFPFESIATRFVVQAGEEPEAGIYYVTLHVPLINNSVGTAKVELHVGAGDPSYIQETDIFFNVDFETPAGYYLSQEIQIQNPTGSGLTDVANGSFYQDKLCQTRIDNMAVVPVPGNPGTFQVKVSPTSDGAIAFGEGAYFKLQSNARMVYTAVFMPIGVHALNPENIASIKYTKALVADKGNQSTSTNATYVLLEAADTSVVRTISTDISLRADSANPNSFYENSTEIGAFYPGTAKFDVEFVAAIQLSQISAERAILRFNNNDISATNSETSPTQGGSVTASSAINLNDLDSYVVPMTATFYRNDGSMIAANTISLSTNSAANNNDLVEIVEGSEKKSADGKYLNFKLRLINQSKTLPPNMYLNLQYDLTTTDPTSNPPAISESAINSDVYLKAPPAFFFSAEGSNLALNSADITLHASQKYDLHVLGFQETNPYTENQISLRTVARDNVTHTELQDALNIVRGKVLYVPDAGAMVETITVRLDKATTNNTDIKLVAQLGSKPAITNDDVQLKISDSALLQVYETTLTFIKTSGGNNGGGNNGGGNVGGGNNGDGNVGGGNNGDGNNGDGNSNSDDGNYVGSGGGSTSTGASKPLSVAQATTAANKAIATAKASGSANATISLTNISTLAPAAVRAIVNAANKAGVLPVIVADTKVGNAVVARITLNPTNLTDTGVKLHVTIGNKGVTNIFEKYFNNKTQVVSFAQKDSFRTAVRVAVKVNLAELNTNTLKFYSYDALTNRYSEIKTPAYFIDRNGYVHFSTTAGNHVVITDKALTEQ